MKTKLGISVGLLGATAYFLGLVGGYVPLVILVGYILLFESDRWLKVSGIKAVAVCIFFSVISVIVSLIPNAITLIDNVCRIFEGSFTLDAVTKIVNLVNTIITIAEKVVLLALAFSALNQKTFGFGVVDNLINTHFPFSGNEAVKHSATKMCPNCDTEILANSTFCGSCGNKI